MPTPTHFMSGKSPRRNSRRPTSLRAVKACPGDFGTLTLSFVSEWQYPLRLVHSWRGV